MSLLVNVAQLLKEPIGSIRLHQVADQLQFEEEAEATPVKGSARLMRTDRGVWATGTLHTAMASLCSRCLAPSARRVELRLDDIHLPTVNITTGARLSPEEDDDRESFTIDDHHVLDLTETVRQHLIAATPLKPLCREDCQGLCRRCGADLNEGSCQCSSDEEPARTPLRGLLVGKGDATPTMRRS